MTNAIRSERQDFRYAWFVIGTLLAVGITSYLDRNILALLVEPMKQALHLGDTQVSVLQGFAYAVFYVIFGLPCGALCDRFDRRVVLAVSILFWSAMTAMCGLAHNFTQLFIARAGVGIGEACLAPAAFSMIADYFPPERRGRALSVYNMSNYLGGSASLLVGGAVLHVLGGAAASHVPVFGDVAAWQMAFLVAAAPGLPLAMLVLTLREPARTESLRRRAGMGEFMRHLASAAPAHAAVYFVSAMTAFAGYAVAGWGPTLFIRRFGMVPAQVGLQLGLISAVFGGLGCIASGIVSDRFARNPEGAGRFRIPLLWWPLALTSLVLMAIAPWQALAMFGYALFLVGSGFGLASVAPTIQDINPGWFRGRAMSLHFVVAGLLGLSVAPTLVALATEHVFHDPKALGSAMLLVLTPVILVAFTVCLLAQGIYAQQRLRNREAGGLA